MGCHASLPKKKVVPKPKNSKYGMLNIAHYFFFAKLIAAKLKKKVPNESKLIEAIDICCSFMETVVFLGHWQFYITINGNHNILKRFTRST